MPTMENGATKGRPTRWANKTTRQHLRQFFLLGLEGYSAKGEGNAAAHRAMKKKLPLMHEHEGFQSKMRLHDLKITRERTRLIARELRRNAEAALRLTVMTSDVCQRLTSFRHLVRNLKLN